MDAAPSELDAQALVDANVVTDASDRNGGDAAGPPCRPAVLQGNCEPPENSALPTDLACTGLYADFAKRELACGVVAYKPAFELWSDGAAKQRYVSLPEGGTINASDPNALVFPVGTRFWKEFRTADGSKLLETRLLQKTAAGWVSTSYVWSADASTAIQENEGVRDLHGTAHDVPTRDQCGECHNGRKDRVLGWDGWLLGEGATGISAAALSDRGWLLPGTKLGVSAFAGDEVERAALGYLHVNCGVSCHNPVQGAKARDTGLMLRLESATSAASSSPAFTTGAYRTPDVNAKFGTISAPGGAAPRDYFRDIVPLAPERSLLLVRMQTRGNDGQMPPLASEKLDPHGNDAVQKWIEQMTTSRGYVSDAGT